jgi:hypothetical protein
MSVQRLYNEITRQEEGNVKYPYAIEITDNKILALLLTDNTLHQYFTITINSDSLTLILNRFDDLFNDVVKIGLNNSIIYGYKYGSINVSLKNDCTVVIDINLTGVTKKSLTKFLNTDINIQNIADIVNELYMDSNAYKGDDVLLI